MNLPVRDKNSMHTAPIFSVIMPTLNSEKTLRLALNSIRNQEFPQEDIEILLVDGGSTDTTLDIGAAYGCRVIPNLRVQPECAKHEGLQHAAGKYAIFLDSDEVLENPLAIQNRFQILSNEEGITFVMTGGYKKPGEAPLINDYINLFSDPFSYFMYRVSSDGRFYFQSLARIYRMEKNTPDFGILRFDDTTPLPLADLSAGNTIDLAYLRGHYAEYLKEVDVVPLTFFLLARDSGKAAVLKQDPVIHHCADTLSTYLFKLKWRIIVNTHYANKNKVGAGFSTRKREQPRCFRIRQFFFLPYAILFLPAFLDSLPVAFRAKSKIALLHAPLALYVAFHIIIQSGLKVLGYTPALKPYGKRQG